MKYPLFSKGADVPDVEIAANVGRPGRVRLAIGSGTTGFDIAPGYARMIAQELLDAADEAEGGGSHDEE